MNAHDFADFFGSFVQFTANVLNDPYGIGANLLSYLARPRVPTKVFKYGQCYDRMMRRLPADQMGTLGFAPMDTQIFVKRFQLLNTNNEFYRIAVKSSPTVEDLEAASYMLHGFPIAWAIKNYNLHHMRDVGRLYRGIQPFGGPVKAFINSLLMPLTDIEITEGSGTSVIWEIRNTPSYADHVYLQRITNEMADAWGMPAVTINTFMYKMGLEMRPATAVSLVNEEEASA